MAIDRINTAHDQGSPGELISLRREVGQQFAVGLLAETFQAKERAGCRAGADLRCQVLQDSCGYRYVDGDAHARSIDLEAADKSRCIRVLCHESGALHPSEQGITIV